MAELNVAREMLSVSVKFAEVKDASEPYSVEASTPEAIYRGNCARIGMLSKAEASAVVQAYAKLQARRSVLQAAYGTTRGEASNIVVMPPEHRDILIELERSRIVSIDVAVRELKAMSRPRTVGIGMPE